MQSRSLQQLDKYAFNQELIFKNDKLAAKYSSPTDMGIKVLEHKGDIIIDVKNLSSLQDVIKKATDVAILKVTESDFFMMSPDNFLPLDFFCRKITYLLILS